MPPIQGTAPAFRHAMHRISDPDAFNMALPGSKMAVDFLHPQKLPATAEAFQTSAWSLNFYETNVKARVRGPMPPGWGCVGVTLGSSSSRWYDFHVVPGTFVCIPPGEAFDGHIAPGFACGSIYVPPEVWEQCRALSGVERDCYGSSTAHHPVPRHWASIESGLRATRDLLRAATTDPRQAAHALRDAASYVRRIITTAWESSPQEWRPRESLRNRARLARRAETWMLEHLGEAVQMPEVCLALRVSRRELEYAFRGTFDQSPHDYLQALRLNAVHRALLRADGKSETVIRVALDHGITHLGRFAARYRALFGEAPSVTLRN